MTHRFAPLLEGQDLPFDAWWAEHGQHYEAAVIDAGGTPWPQDENKLAALRRAGLPVSGDPMETRRALWHRRYRPTERTAA
jgi:hypothetical protein